MAGMLDDYPQLTKLIYEGRAVAFFGAGASIGCRSSSGKQCPASAHLAEELMQYFRSESAPNWGLDKVVDFLERNYVDRFKINSKLAEIFDAFVPHQPYLQLFQFRWRAFFTTNFDTLLRQAYDQCKATTHAGQQLIEIWKYPTPVDYGDHSKLYLFALHGSLAHHLDLTLPIVLTERDKIKTRENRARMISQLSSMQGGGTTLFVGYSFQDEVFWELLNELEAVHGLCQSYALMPGVSKADRNFLAQYKVEAIPFGFEEFMGNRSPGDISRSPRFGCIGGDCAAEHDL